MGKGRARRVAGNHKKDLRGKHVVKRRQHSQATKPVASSKASAKHIQQRNVRVPFSAADSVLLVGEGDFSFALSLLKTFRPFCLVATAFDTSAELHRKYPEVDRTLLQLEALPSGNEKKIKSGPDSIHTDNESFEGFSLASDDSSIDSEDEENSPAGASDQIVTISKVFLGVDATKLSSTHKKLLRPYTPFTKIVFNFPHVGGLSTDVNRQVRSNQQLLVNFFNSAKPLLARPETSLQYGNSRDRSVAQGQILVSLFEGEPYTLWNIRDLARHCGLQVVESFRFPWSAYPGYKHARTIGDIATGKDRSDEGSRGGAWRGEERDARMYVIEVKGSGSVPRTGPSAKKGRGGVDDSNDED
jgi:25S rRNA (uracil2634-N3)-methyltransferase